MKAELKNGKAAHRRRHLLLHRHLDELFADYIRHNPDQRTYTHMPVIDLINWSSQQTKEPDHEC